MAQSIQIKHCGFRWLRSCSVSYVNVAPILCLLVLVFFSSRFKFLSIYYFDPSSCHLSPNYEWWMPNSMINKQKLTEVTIKYESGVHENRFLQTKNSSKTETKNRKSLIANIIIQKEKRNRFMKYKKMKKKTQRKDKTGKRKKSPKNQRWAWTDVSEVKTNCAHAVKCSLSVWRILGGWWQGGWTAPEFE